MSEPLRIEGELAVPQAAAVRERLLAWLAETDPATAGDDAAAAGSAAPLQLDLSAVEAFDSAGVQLLLALRHSLADRGQVLRIAQASEPVADALRCYGLQSLLQPAAA